MGDTCTLVVGGFAMNHQAILTKAEDPIKYLGENI